ncbi:MAG: hypothetical protein HOJ35_01505 [Bdellovibrionales bacterium]|nr:hypothetical protein [Bdellovibrionales bacterium]
MNETEPSNKSQESEFSVSIGDLLKNAREKKGFSLKKISQGTKIGLNILDNLEQSKLSKLPNKTFVIGFVSAYAKMLDLNKLECINVLKQTYLNQEIKEGDVSVIQTSNEDHTFNFSTIIPWAVGAALLISIIYFLNKQFKKGVSQTAPSKQVITRVTKRPIVKVINENDQLSQTPTTTQDKIKLINTEKNEADLSPVEKIATIKNVEENQISETEEKEEEKDKIVFRNFAQVPFTFANKEEQSKALSNFMPDQIQNSPAVNKQNIFINATNGTTWLAYKKDNSTIKQLTLAQGQTKLISGDEVQLFLGNVHATKIFFNNQLLKIKSNTGVKSLVFPIEKSTQYKIPMFIFKEGQAALTSEEYLSQKKEDQSFQSTLE